MSSPTIPETPRTTFRRLPQRGTHDRAAIERILDEALFCHLGFSQDAQPFVIPTIHARVEDRIYVHGSTASRMLRSLAQGVPVCLTATLLDGLVLARSAFHHSMNYRSVMVLGRAELVQEEDEKALALKAVVEHVVAGRFAEVRPPSPKEIKVTSVLRLPLTEASAKVRTGGPVDDEEDYSLPVWAGVLPLRLRASEPQDDGRVLPGVSVSPSVLRASQKGR